MWDTAEALHQDSGEGGVLQSKVQPEGISLCQEIPPAPPVKGDAPISLPTSKEASGIKFLPKHLHLLVITDSGRCVDALNLQLRILTILILFQPVLGLSSTCPAASRELLQEAQLIPRLLADVH